jgi:DNA-binding CsgD family transcriptional regulator
MLRLVTQAPPCKRRTYPVAELASANKLSWGSTFHIVRSATQSQELTPREKEVLHWVANGKRNGEIDLILGISARTLQKHVQHILDKLNVETRSAAAAVWFRANTHTEI